jgi:hypothetical protein
MDRLLCHCFGPKAANSIAVFHGSVGARRYPATHSNNLFFGRITLCTLVVAVGPLFAAEGNADGKKDLEKLQGK